MARPDNLGSINWKSLPIALHKGAEPRFDLKDILLNEDKTVRFDCQFETIQQLLEHERGVRIPKNIATVFERLQKWQLVVPTHIDVAQLLFLGRETNDMDSIPIDAAQATIKIHRGADGGSKLDRGKYITIWTELAGIFPDSNGDQRIVAVLYNWAGPNPDEAIAAAVNVSFSETEYERKATLMDQFLPSTVDLTDHRWGIYRTCALTTNGMVASLKEPHKSAIYLHTNPKGGFTLQQIGGQDSGPMDFDQGITKLVSDETIEVSLTKRFDGQSSWTVIIPRTLERVDPQKVAVWKRFRGILRGPKRS